MANVHEIVARLRAEGQSDYVSGTQEATEATEGLADATEETEERVDRSWGEIGNAVALGLGAAGGALEAYNRSQQDIRDQAGRVANAIGQEQDTVLAAAAEMNNATRDVDELVAMMETGSQRGLESVADLQEFAANWDTIGDATGENAAALADASTALETVGIAAGEEHEAMNAFGFISQDTTGTVREFMNMVERAGRELGDQAPHVDTMAALFGAMEDRGLGAQQAQREVQQALRESEGDLAAAQESLGINNETLDEYRDKVAASSDVINDNAQVHADSRTTLQELSSSLESAMTKYSGLASAAEVASPVLMGSAAAIFLVNQGLGLYRTIASMAIVQKIALAVAVKAKAAAFGVATVATWALNTALAVLTSPITLVVAAIGGLVAAGWYLYNNWDEVTAWVKEAWSSVGDFLGDVWDGIVETFKRGANAAIGPINSLIDAFNAVQITLPTIPDWVPIVGGKGGQTIGFDIANIPTFDVASQGPGRPSVGANSATPQSAAHVARNRGGGVPGGGPDRDSVLAALTPGEWVLRRGAADALGPRLLTALNEIDRRPRGLSALDALLGGDTDGPGVLHRNLGGAVGFARSQAGSPYGWGAVGPGAYDCSGWTSALTNEAMGLFRHRRRHTTATVGSDPAYARGVASGLMLGVSSAAQLGGVGHMGATVAGLPTESRGSRGVVTGPGARGHNDSLFRQRYGHRGFAGEGGALDDPYGSESNIPFWARPVLDAIAAAFGSAFGIEDATWDAGDVVDGPWTGRVNVGRGTRDVVSPEPLLRRTVEDAVAAAGHGVTIRVDGDVLDPEAWFDRHRSEIADAVGAATAERRARR